MKRYRLVRPFWMCILLLVTVTINALSQLAVAQEGAFERVGRIEQVNIETGELSINGVAYVFDNSTVRVELNNQRVNHGLLRRDLVVSFRAAPGQSSEQPRIDYIKIIGPADKIKEFSKQ